MARDLGVPVTTEGEYCFISYNSDDAEAVGKIVKGLHQEGVPLWYDNGINLGENYHEIIAERIDKCSCVLIFFTKNILNKGKDSYVYNEYELAIDFSGKPVYIVMMDEIIKSTVPCAIRTWYVGLCRLHNINAFASTLDQTIDKIIEAVSRDMNIPPSDENDNDAEKWFALGLKAYDSSDYKEAAEHFRIAAELGLAQAQFNLGVCYKNGQGVQQDYSQAVQWYRKAAEQGDADAQYNLGVCYYNGRGVQQDYSQAVQWYRKAAEQGHASAQKNLGFCYDNGRGVQQDYSQAIQWYRKAAEQGHASAQNNLGVCYANGRGVQQDYSQAVQWYRKAAEQGHASAQFNLGVRYEKGNGVKQDFAEAIFWYKKAADQGDADAKSALERLTKKLKRDFSFDSFLFD